MRNCTLLFLVKRKLGNIEEVCLAMKKKGFGVGRWNGVGGKVEEGETIEGAAMREAEEEIGVKVLEMKKVAELEFSFSNKAEWNQKVFTFICDKWELEPKESEEMKPEWFLIKDIPFNNMWPDDIFWLLEVLQDKLVKASFTFSNDDVIENQKVEIISNF